MYFSNFCQNRIYYFDIYCILALLQLLQQQKANYLLTAWLKWPVVVLLNDIYLLGDMMLSYIFMGNFMANFLDSLHWVWR